MFSIEKLYSTDELVKLTQDLVRIPSHKDVPTREKEVAEFIYDFCKKNGIEAELNTIVDERKNIIAYIRGSGKGPSLMLNGHLDTVTAYDMKIDPFAAEMKDGLIFGRGTVDMKGSIACMLITMLAIKRGGVTLDGDIIFTGIIGEEGKSEGTEYIVKSGLKADAAIVGEPTNYEYAIGHRGLEWLDVNIIGKAAHSGKPEKGINAIEKAMVFMEKVKEKLQPKLKERYNAYMGESMMNYGTMHCGSKPSTVADRCTINIDRRYVPGESTESVIKEFQDIIDEINKNDPDFHAEIKLTPENILDLHHPPLITSENEPIVLAVKEAIKEVTKKEAKMMKGMGWTDAALLSDYAKIPTVVFGAGDLALAHTGNERIAIKDLVNTTNIYWRIIDRFCNSKVNS